MTAVRAAAFGAALAAALVLSGCGGGGGAGGQGDVNQGQDLTPGAIGALDQPFSRPRVPDMGEVRVAVDEGFQDYNNNTGAANNIANNYLLALTTPSPYFEDRDFSLKIDKDYLESVTVKSANPQVIEYRWRPDAVWSDGAPVGCKDMYLAYLANANAPARAGNNPFDTQGSGFDQLAKLDCSPDGRTVTATFATPFADWRGMWSMVAQGGNQLLPAHVLEQRTGIGDITKVRVDVDSPELRKAADFYTHGWTDFKPDVDLSAGPYLITSSTRNQQATLERNPRWWGPPGGPSKIDVQAVTDSQAATQALLNKETPVIGPQADPTVAEQVRAGGDFDVFARGGQTFEHLDFNMGRPIFRDHPELRAAVAACINRQDIVDKLVKGIDPKIKPLGSFTINPNEAGYVDHYVGVGTGDTARAKKLLEDAGWRLGADGVYAKDGQRAAFAIGHKLVDRRGQTVQLMVASCKPAGIAIGDAGQQSFNDQQLPASDFDAALFAWVGSPIKSSLVQNYISKSRGGVANYDNYSNPQVDDLLTQSNSELDYGKRLALFNRAEDLMAKDLHSVPLFQLIDFAASDRAYSPVSYLLPVGGVLWNAFAWTKQGS